MVQQLTDISTVALDLAEKYNFLKSEVRALSEYILNLLEASPPRSSIVQRTREELMDLLSSGETAPSTETTPQIGRISGSPPRREKLKRCLRMCVCSKPGPSILFIESGGVLLPRDSNRRRCGVCGGLLVQEKPEEPGISSDDEDAFLF